MVTHYIHRGLAKKKLKENTLAAFKYSFKKGYGIETDIHCTKDNKIICFHDFNLKNKFKVNRRIKETNYNEIKKNLFLFCCVVLVTISTIYANDKDNIKDFVSLAGIKFEILKNGESNRRLIWIHGDEKTAELLIRKHLKKNNGTAYLIHNTEREVVINGFLLDPNRIFTNDGAKRNIIKLNNNISKSELNKTIKLISEDRDEFFESISPLQKDCLLLYIITFESIQLIMKFP